MEDFGSPQSTALCAVRQQPWGFIGKDMEADLVEMYGVLCCTSSTMELHRQRYGGRPSGNVRRFAPYVVTFTPSIVDYVRCKTPYISTRSASISLPMKLHG